MRDAVKFRTSLLACVLGGALVAAAPGFAAESSRLADAMARQDTASLRALLRDKANVNAPQPDGATALHWAAHWDDLELAAALIGAGANVNARNDYSATPLSLACTNGNPFMVEKLLAAGASPNLAAPSGETPLMRCARSGSVAAVTALLERKPNVNAKNSEQGQTALMWAVSQKHPAVSDVLIKAGADIHARSAAGFTPLLFAARVGDTKSAELLLAAGADLEAAAPNGMTPLVLASASGQEEIGIFLLAKGANPNARDELGATALHYTMLKGITALNEVRLANYVSHLFRPSLNNLIKPLLARKADPNIAIEKQVPLGGSRSRHVIGATPFLLAAASPDPEAMRMLAAAGANAKAKTADGLTAVMLAAGLARGQDFNDQEKAISLEATRIAIDAGVDVNAVSDDQLTALHGAAANGANGVVQLLVARGAKMEVRDRYQQTPLSIAAGERLPWIPDGDELGEIIQPSTRDLLLKLGAVPIATPGYFQPPKEDSDVYRINRGVRGLAAPK
jgi:uncharacterized protein